ncbi:hypothetical protein [Candidatus Binatus sp.]|uniref:hypothetical protein n=1 Tax=Candidatus Binatus sp. TaxID=2811406 RepID=UPI003C6FCB08
MARDGKVSSRAEYYFRWTALDASDLLRTASHTFWSFEVVIRREKYRGVSMLMTSEEWNK